MGVAYCFVVQSSNLRAESLKCSPMWSGGMGPQCKGSMSEMVISSHGHQDRPLLITCHGTCTVCPRCFCANSLFILRARSTFHICLQRPHARDYQLLSLEFSEIDLFFLHLTRGLLRSSHVLPKYYTLNPKLHLLN